MGRGLLDIESLARQEIEAILDRSKDFQPAPGETFKRFEILRGRTVVNLFFEASTRTRTSFEIAAKRLGADIISITAVRLECIERRIIGRHTQHPWPQCVRTPSLCAIPPPALRIFFPVICPFR